MKRNAMVFKYMFTHTHTHIYTYIYIYIYIYREREREQFLSFIPGINAHIVQSCDNNWKETHVIY